MIDDDQVSGEAALCEDTSQVKADNLDRAARTIARARLDDAAGTAPFPQPFPPATRLAGLDELAVDRDLERHPSADVLWRFMVGGLAPAEMRQALRHLLRGCPRCQERARVVWNLAPLAPDPLDPINAEMSPGALSDHEALLPPEPALAAPGASGAVSRAAQVPQPPLTEPLVSQAASTLAAPAPPLDSQSAAYDAVLDRVFARITVQEAAIEAAQRRARGLFDELMQHPPARQDLLVHNSTRFRDRMLCESLLAASHEAGFRDPAQSQQLARLAVQVVERLSKEGDGEAAEAHDPSHAHDSPDSPGANSASDARRPRDRQPTLDQLAGLRARVWAQLGNALRVGNDLDAAAAAFASAEALLAAHPRIGPLDKAKVLDLKASLCRELRQLAAAGRLLDRVIAIYSRLGQSNLLGRALNQKALVLDEAGDLEGSIALLRQALDLLDPHDDPRWFLSVRHNLIRALVFENKPREAFALLFHTRPLYIKMGDRMTLLRLRWIEGLVARGLNRPDQAEAAFREVRDAFVELGLAYDAALASLDLASVFIPQGRTGEVRQLAQQMMTFFESRQIHREAMAAFLVFCEAAHLERAGLGLVQEVALFLKQARHSPGLHYTPSNPNL